MVFRDTRNFYLDPHAITVAAGLVRFALRHGGRRILDLGCATGAYCLEISKHGRQMTGADINAEYVRIARTRGVDAHVVSERLPFPDGAFDTTLLFEVLEHAPAPHALLREARRVSRRNVLVTVPNCEDHADLRRSGVLCEHFADLDHRHFFTKHTLDVLLRTHFREVVIEHGDPLNPFALARSGLIRRLGALARRLRLVSPRSYIRLYAVAQI